MSWRVPGTYGIEQSEMRALHSRITHVFARANSGVPGVEGMDIDEVLRSARRPVDTIAVSELKSNSSQIENRHILDSVNKDVRYRVEQFAREFGLIRRQRQKY